MILLRFEFRAAPVRGALRRSPRRWGLAMLVACLGGCAGYTDWRQGNKLLDDGQIGQAGADAAGLQGESAALPDEIHRRARPPCVS